MLYNDLALFTSVAQHLNYSEAARALKVTPSLVSRRISVLEEQLGFRLFERTTRQVRLTAEGQELLDLCEAPVEALGAALVRSHEKTAGVSGTIRITAPLLAAKRDIWPELQRFLTAYPEISMELIPADEYLDFFRDGIDLAFRLGPLPPSDLIARPLWEVSYSVCASPKLLEQFDLSHTLSVDQLHRLPTISSNLPWRFEQDSQFTPNCRKHHMASLELLQNAVAAGLGIGFLPTGMIEAGIEPIQIEGLTPKSRTMHLIYPSRRMLPARVRRLVDWFSQPAK